MMDSRIRMLCRGEPIGHVLLPILHGTVGYWIPKGTRDYDGKLGHE